MIKEFYESGQWKKKAVRNVTIKHWITVAEYEEIVGEPFEN